MSLTLDSQICLILGLRNAITIGGPNRGLMYLLAEFSGAEF